MFYYCSMKTPIVLLMLLSSPVFLFAQETVEVKPKPNRYSWYEDPLVVYNGADSTEMKVDAIPEMVGASYYWQRFLNKNLRYPPEAIDNKRMGRVVIGFIVHPDGTASDFWIKVSTFKPLDEEALRVVKLLPHKWVPAKVNGKPVKVSWERDIVFRLESE